MNSWFHNSFTDEYRLLSDSHCTKCEGNIEIAEVSSASSSSSSVGICGGRLPATPRHNKRKNNDVKSSNLQKPMRDTSPKMKNGDNQTPKLMSIENSGGGPFSRRRSSSQTMQPRKRKIDSSEFFPCSFRSFDGMSENAAIRSAKKGIDTLCLSDKLVPSEDDELLIHPKKAEELKRWICSKMAIERGGKTLLLSGPCGSSKTTSVRMICDELGVEVLEFDGNAQEFEMNNTGEEVWEKSAMKMFIQFMRDSQLSSIEKMSMKHRLLIIEQLPSMFYKDIHLFHNTLREFVRSSRCMIVIILSNIESYWELNPARLFPVHILDEMRIDHIKFNPISSINMTKVVKRAFSAVGLKSTGNLAAVREIVSAADGDIRNAMNIIDFFLKNKGENALSTLTKSSAILKNLPSCGRVQFFHFLGKIMYAKRSDVYDEKWTKTEKKLCRKALAKRGRSYPPKEDVNQLIEQCFVSGSHLAGYVFEHEPSFAPTPSAMKNVLSNLCMLDVRIDGNFDGANLIDKYLLDVIIRSTIYHNHRGPSSPKSAAQNRKGLYQFAKPKVRNAEAKRDEQKSQAITLFSASFQRSSDITTLMVPMLPLLNFLWPKPQLNFITQMAIVCDNGRSARLNNLLLTQAPKGCRGSNGGCGTATQLMISQPYDDNSDGGNSDLVAESSYLVEDVDEESR